MQKYICTHCDNLICDTSICPICGNRTEIFKSEIYYCDECNIPLYEDVCPICGRKAKKIGTDLRPVFAEERLLLEVLLGKPFAFANSSIWCTGGSNYIINGKKVRLNFAELSKQNPNDVIAKINENKNKNLQYEKQDLDNEFINNFIKANENHLKIITDEATKYIQDISSKYSASSMFVSFSGGKDSTVVSHLVMTSIGNETIPHIYGDTTLEYPETLKYIEEFKRVHSKTPLLVAKNKDQDFKNLCEVIGPPSRVMRWCCTIFKTGSITKKIEQLYKNETRLLSFQGVRRAESAARSKYDRDTDSPKITKQHVSAPIIDWTDFDVWLYLLSNKVEFNNAYRQGFSRVGCWCCPNNSNWSAFLSAIYMNDEYNKFYGMLYKFARNIGKEDWKQYVDEGSWKARQGGNGLSYSKNTVVEFKPCVLEENSVNFSLNKPIDDDLYTLFKPFGTINKDIGNKRLNEVYILSKHSNEPLLKLSGKIGSSTLKVTLLAAKYPFKNVKDMTECVRNQITKYQTCIACSYCQSVCKYNALKVVNLEKGNVTNKSVLYTIDENKCVGCLECVKHFPGGCYMKKVLRIKKRV